MLQVDLPFYWILLCLLPGVVYAYLLYSISKVPWSRNWNIGLFVLRFLVVSALCLLLLDPYVKATEEIVKNKQVVFVWDDSRSMLEVEDSQKLKSLVKKVSLISAELERSGKVDVQWKNLAAESLTKGKVIDYSRESTPLHTALQKIKEQNGESLLEKVVLVSDGIYNQGMSPDFAAYGFEINTLGLGDTIPQKDLFIDQLLYNKVAYQNNLFPIKVRIGQSAYPSVNTTVYLLKNDQIVASKNMVFKEEVPFQEVDFLVEAKEQGLNAYTVRLQAAQEEENLQNNSQKFFVNVLQGKKKILLLADAPHPDISAISKAIEQNNNYELDLAITGVNELKSSEAYDLAILFHLPNRQNAFREKIASLAKSNTPLWLIVGSKPVQLNEFNQISSGIRLTNWSEIDQAGVSYSETFDRFDLTQEQKNTLQNLPPVYMPFSAAQMDPRAEAYFYKKVGSVNTDQAVAFLHEQNDKRQAVLLMEGFWQWRLYEYIQNNSFELFDTWVIKTVRWLTTKQSKRQFNVYPLTERFKHFEEVKFKVESYDEVFEPISGNTVDLTISSQDTSFSFNFKTVKLDPVFEIGSMAEGVYEYRASTMIAGKAFESVGKFVVEKTNIESLSSRANFLSLRKLAEKNEGNFFALSDVEALEMYLKEAEYPQIISSKADLKPLNTSFIAIMIILALIFGEWFIRRYYGSY